MKAKILVVLIALFAISFTNVSEARGQVSVNVSVFAKIPVAPNMNITIGASTYPAPRAGYIWVDGYFEWDYRYNQYVWVEGYWIRPPYAGAYWVPGYWEYVRGGYRWIPAGWLPRGHQMHFGFFKNRYDYYGRPVYYHRPGKQPRNGFAFGYDHNPRHRGNMYSSSPHYNSSGKGKDRPNQGRQPEYTSPRETNRGNASGSRENDRNTSTVNTPNRNNQQQSVNRTPERNQQSTNRESTRNNQENTKNTRSTNRESTQSSRETVRSNSGTSQRSESVKQTNSNTRSSGSSSSNSRSGSRSSSSRN